MVFPTEALRRRDGFVRGGVLLPEPRRVWFARMPASPGVDMLLLRLEAADAESSVSSNARPIDLVLATGRMDLKGGAGSALGEGTIAFVALAIFCLL
jgi:hypothetical protein